MAEKLMLDLSVVLPGVPDERDACVARLAELLQAEGFRKRTVPGSVCIMTRNDLA